MSKLMKSLPMKELMARIIGEWEARKSIFDIPGELVERVLELERKSPGFSVNGVQIGLPVGPAAGPHTQIAPNLVAAWLAGSRVFELKTIQENDRLEIDKPCIDAMDEGHNTEWSTELLLEEALAEYVRGWVAIHVLRAALCESPGSLMFNMSVGYTLDGIKGKKVDAFIEGMRFPEKTAVWESAVREAGEAIDAPSFAKAFGAAGARRAGLAIKSIPKKLVHSVTLSTMHGCPPAEIERIGSYLIEEKGFDTYIKLNPTLLGYDAARGILDATGWQRIEISRSGFEHDLQFDGALALIASLRGKALRKGVAFGIKLSNTLANTNDKNRLPGSERYMSGRALFPITIRLAAKLAAALSEPLAFSFCGGISAHNAGACFSAGLGPLTFATEILKPGGYLRIEAIADAAVKVLVSKEPGVKIPRFPDADKLGMLAAAALKDPVYRGDYKKGETVIKKLLPLTDCFAAPCKEACPAGQKPPAYIKALARGESENALAIIYEDNPLPHITGMLCDHQCMYACSRVDYEGPVEIRAMKMACAMACSLPPKPKSAIQGKGKTAVFGAGPAGLSCAHYLALEGYPVTVFENAASAGGIPANVIPQFRISREDIASDIDRIRAMGAEFRFGWSGTIDIAALKAEGFSSFVLATGAPVPRAMTLGGSGIKSLDALEFLQAAHEKSSLFDHARNVVVAGGGNTAMDAARVAARLPGKPSVTILYRRTLAEMPADLEEFEGALADGVGYGELSLPESMEQIAGTGRSCLLVREMELGEPDASGRRAPVSSARTRRLDCDLIITAIGELPDRSLFDKLGIDVGRDGRPAVDETSMSSNIPFVFVVGDARRGPATIIAGIADGRKASQSILNAAGISVNGPAMGIHQPDREALSRRGAYLPSLKETTIDSRHTKEWIQREAERCMTCGAACLRCVEVCPNRANFALPVMASAEGALKQMLQILHVDDLCNECGNCGFFCPFEGEPFSGKPTLFSGESDLRASTNAGFSFLGDMAAPDLLVRFSPGKEEAIKLLPWPDWADATNQTALVSMAGEMFTRHKYLISGGNR